MAEPTVVSANRVNAYTTCGVAYRLQYVDGLPPVLGAGASALFGRVVHLALDEWSADRSGSLPNLMVEAWKTECDGTTVAGFLKEYEALSVEAREWEDEFKKRRPKIVAPRRTKEWRSSSVGRQTSALMAKWLDRLNEGSPWRFGERDALPSLYDESLDLGVRYAEKWRWLPAPHHREFRFRVPWRDWMLIGAIDSVEPVIDRATGELLGTGVIDYKTGGRPGPAMRDYRQLVMYYVAVRELVSQGGMQMLAEPLYVGVDYVRLGYRRWWRLGPADVERLAGELESYTAGIKAGVFLPASKNTNADFCDYGDACCLRSCATAGGEATEVFFAAA